MLPLKPIAAAAVLALLATVPVCGQKSAAVKVEIEKTSDGYRLLRAGLPFPIRGVGGSGSLELLEAAGGNSVRTWGADNLQPILDDAQKLGLTVTVGLWLGHERHGFNYNDADQVAKQFEAARETVLRYRDHPAVLMWGIGNEMEGYEKGDNAAVWSAVNNIAAMAKRLDANHPTMTVVAEIGGDRVKNIHRLCPEVDVVGINSYAGAATLPKRYREAGGTKPYVITEFGPPGSWEVGKTAWGAPVEPTSTEKAAAYRRAYEEGVRKEPLCLGAYAFLWGHKQETTATWFGMLLPDGSRTGAVDAITEAWTGSPPANRAPAIASLKLSGADQVDPGAVFRATLDASDPERDPLKVTWVLQPEADRYGTGGDAEAALPTYPEALLKTTERQVEVRAPKDPAGYRLFAYVRDGKGGAAVANVPFLVKGTVKAPEALEARLPLVLYDEADRKNPPYFPTGWMGNTGAMKLDEAHRGRPHSGATCIRAEYRLPADWGGVVWQHPANDWGDLPGGWNLEGAKRLVFCARGEKGGEVVGFQLGLLGREKKFPDSAGAKLEGVTLTPEWKEYRIELAGKDLRRIKTGFCWVVAGQGAPVVFYLDDVRFE